MPAGCGLQVQGIVPFSPLLKTQVHAHLPCAQVRLLVGGGTLRETRVYVPSQAQRPQWHYKEDLATGEEMAVRCKVEARPWASWICLLHLLLRLQHLPKLPNSYIWTATVFTASHSICVRKTKPPCHGCIRAFRQQRWLATKVKVILARRGEEQQTGLSG